jgi:hypothetical protein
MVRGSAHEATVGLLLAALPCEQWSVVGHVVVGPSGVFVIDAKGWSGTVEVRDGVLRHEGRARATTVADATDAASQIAHLVPGLPAGVVRPVLCFVRPELLVETASGVLVCSTAALLEVLMSGPTVLTPAEARSLAAELERELRVVVGPRPVSAARRQRREPTVLERAAARWAWSA